VKTSWIVAAALIAAAGGGVWYAFVREPPEKPVEVATVRAKKDKVTKKVTGVGHVEPVTQIRVSSNTTGDLLELHVNEGDFVRRGALLALIDPIRVAAAVKQMEAAMKSAEADVTLQEARLGQAKIDHLRSTKLHAERLTADADYDRASSDLGVAAAQLTGAKERVAQAKAALDEAQARLALTKLFAPVDGTVLEIDHKVGERIRGSDLAEDVVMIVAPLNAMQVQVEVVEQDIVKIVPGQTAEAEVDALGGVKVPGHVLEIGSSAIIKNRGTEAETTSFKVKIGLDAIPDKLRSGMSASVSIVTDVHDGVVAVPLEALTARFPAELETKTEEQRRAARAKMLKAQNAASGAATDDDLDDLDKTRIAKPRERPVRILFVVENGRAVAHRVTTGISSESEIEVKSGVDPGAEVIVGPYRALAKLLLPNTPVKVIDAQGAPDAKPDAGAAVFAGEGR
jgi:HlyD family secretion protein